MYLLISGPSCSGKTSLATGLLKQEATAAYFEPTSTSRYYPLFLQDMPRHALKNQVDFMRISFHQEQALAASATPLVVQDAGLLVCHQVYSAYFTDKGYLSQSQYQALARFFTKKMSRCKLPDLVIHLTAQVAVLEARALQRDKRIIHNVGEIMPYWDTLVSNLQEMKIPLLVVDTSQIGAIEVANTAMDWLRQQGKEGRPHR